MILNFGHTAAALAVINGDINVPFGGPQTYGDTGVFIGCV
jgi:hypothetical protein